MTQTGTFLFSFLPIEDTEETRQVTTRYADHCSCGNANVGKSDFNQWKVVKEVATDRRPSKSGKGRGPPGKQFKIVDLPGIYSFNTYSPEEQVTREYILTQHPDIVINVLDATSLERNLYLTLQLKEMAVPMVIALNYADIANKKHINIDTAMLGQIFDAPVINTIAIKGIGVHELVDSALAAMEAKGNGKVIHDLECGPEVETRIVKLADSLAGTGFDYPLRWTAIKLLEKDNEILDNVKHQTTELADFSQTLSEELSGIHGEDSASVIAAERYVLSAKIAKQISSRVERDSRVNMMLDNISLHPVAGYFLFLATMAVTLVIVSLFGGWLTEVITKYIRGP